MTVAANGEEGLARAKSDSPAMVLLDLNLPDVDGIDVCRELRRSSDVPILMLTARDDDIDKIIGLEVGADDYLTKPFNPRELVARIQAILRRSGVQADTGAAALNEKVVIGDIQLDTGSRTVARDNNPIHLTAMEFNVLEVLLRNAGRVVERESLVEQVLDRRYSPYDRSIDVHVSNLRKKLGHEIEGMERIKSVRQVGYLYALPSKDVDTVD